MPTGLAQEVSTHLTPRGPLADALPIQLVIPKRASELGAVLPHVHTAPTHLVVTPLAVVHIAVAELGDAKSRLQPIVPVAGVELG